MLSMGFIVDVQSFTTKKQILYFHWVLSDNLVDWTKTHIGILKMPRVSGLTGMFWGFSLS